MGTPLSDLAAKAEKAKKQLAKQLRKLAEQIDHLDWFIKLARSGGRARPKPRRRRKLSKQTREKMAAAQRRRWQKAKSAKKKS